MVHQLWITVVLRRTIDCAGITNSVRPQLEHCSNVPPLCPKPGLLRKRGETSPALQIDNFPEHHPHRK